jgi:hypothetical protein
MGQVLKHKKQVSLVYLPGCMGCGKVCKYNTAIADPVAASEYEYNDAYGCNSRLQGFEVEEGSDNEVRREKRRE